MIQTAEITFNLNDIKLPTIICRNEETGRQIQFTLVDDSGEPVTLPNTATFTFLMIKPDGNFYESIIPAGLLTVSDQLTASGGLGHYAIKITDTDTLIYSGQGDILIDDHLITDETIESVSEIYGLHFPEDFLTIYSGVAVLDDTTTSTGSTWSSSKISNMITSGALNLIDDSHTVTNKTWSSNKINSAISAGALALIDDTDAYSNKTWSGQKIQAELDDIDTLHVYATAEHITGTWIDNTPVYERTFVLDVSGAANPYTYNIPFDGCRLLKYDPHYIEYVYGGQTYTVAGTQLATNTFNMCDVRYQSEIPPTLIYTSYLGSVESHKHVFTLQYIKV